MCVREREVVGIGGVGDHARMGYVLGWGLMRRVLRDRRGDRQAEL